MGALSLFLDSKAEGVRNKGEPAAGLDLRLPRRSEFTRRKPALAVPVRDAARWRREPEMDLDFADKKGDETVLKETDLEDAPE